MQEEENEEVEKDNFPLNEAVIERPVSPTPIVAPMTEEEETEDIPPVPTLEPETDHEEEEGSHQEEPTPEQGTPSHESKKPGAKKMNDLFSKTIVKLNSKLLPELFHSFSKMDETKIFILEQSGQLKQGTFDLVRKMNTENKEVIASEVGEYEQELLEPLQEMLQQKGLSVGPEYTLAVAASGMLFSVGSVALKIRKENKSVLEQIVALNTPKPEPQEKDDGKEDEK